MEKKFWLLKMEETLVLSKNGRKVQKNLIFFFFWESSVHAEMLMKISIKWKTTSNTYLPLNKIWNNTKTCMLCSCSRIYFIGKCILIGQKTKKARLYLPPNDPLNHQNTSSLILMKCLDFWHLAHLFSS